jgi:release factor H-coupled RctB family protein
LPDSFTLIANSKCWIEDDSLSQLKKFSSSPGIVHTVGLPDLHPGKTPIGAVFASTGIVYPFLVGNDVGCGMALFGTRTNLKKFRPERAAGAYRGLSSLKELPFESPYAEPSPIKELGTIGGGNHFAEFQAVEKIFLKDEFKSLDLDRDKVLLLVHSGSRDLGQRIYEEFLSVEGISLEDPRAGKYLESHAEAVLWAGRNRRAVASKVTGFLGSELEYRPPMDSAHNFVEERDGVLLHRKGAVSALQGPVVIPGSRGTLSFIVKPTPDTRASLFSLSHGAGRKWPRHLCKGRLEGKYRRSDLSVTALKSRVICHDKALLYEEAPEAYKDVSQVVAALTDAGLCQVVCSLRPLLTLKI